MVNQSITPLLKGKYVTLKLLATEHLNGLADAGKGVDWSWMFSSLDSKEMMKSWVKERMSDFRNGSSATYTVSLNSSGKIVGSTSFLDIRALHRGLEIGRTWYSPSVQGTNVNPECKYMLLMFAFQEWGAIRVQLKTDHMNIHSQNTIVKLGAVYEGELRNHMIRRDGTIRHTKMYSITEEEWPNVKKGLEERLK